MMNLPPTYKSLISLDKQVNTRFYVSLLIALSVHLFVFFIGWWLYTHFFKTPKLHKINTENLLILKRGSSLDKSANTPGAPPPTIASQNTSSSTPREPSPLQTPQDSSQQNPKDTPKTKPLDSSAPLPKAAYDPRKLQFFSPATQGEQSKQALGQDKGLDRQTRRDIDKLYGDEWGDLGSAERDFITSNLREIARITQRYLTYPNTAAYLNQSGENAIEFYLLPNGDIQGLKLLLSSGFVLLDKNSQKTIEIAYKDYPRPKQRTLIRFHITYTIYR